MLKKFFLIFLTLVMIVSVVTAPTVALAASVEDQIPDEQVDSTPMVDEDGNEVAFKVDGEARTNSPTAIGIMLLVVLICFWLIVDGIRSYIRKAKKESETRFTNMNE